MAMKRSLLLLDRLRRAIDKVRFLLSFSATRWIASAIARQPSGPRRLSFKSQPSLLDSMDVYFDVALARTPSSTSGYVSRSTSSVMTEMSRTTSDASASGDDINERASRFIENFHRQLEIERQVSLELRYYEERSSPEKTASLTY